METMTLTVTQCHCVRCNYDWFPKTAEKPRVCARCRSAWWDKPRRYQLKTPEQLAESLIIRKLSPSESHFFKCLRNGSLHFDIIKEKMLAEGMSRDKFSKVYMQLLDKKLIRIENLVITANLGGTP